MPPTIRKGYRPSHDFKIDLPKGEEGENTVAFLLHMQQGDLVEVKRDYWVSETGNVAIEFAKRKGSTWVKSGIAVTKASWWAILLNGSWFRGDVIVLIRIERLIAIARAHFGLGHVSVGGDNESSKFVLVPVGELLSTEVDF